MIRSLKSCSIPARSLTPCFRNSRRSLRLVLSILHVVVYEVAAYMSLLMTHNDDDGRGTNAASPTQRCHRFLYRFCSVVFKAVKCSFLGSATIDVISALSAAVAADPLPRRRRPCFGLPTYATNSREFEQEQSHSQRRAAAEGGCPARRAHQNQ